MTGDRITLILSIISWLSLYPGLYRPTPRPPAFSHPRRCPRRWQAPRHLVACSTRQVGHHSRTSKCHILVLMDLLPRLHDIENVKMHFLYSWEVVLILHWSQLVRLQYKLWWSAYARGRGGRDISVHLVFLRNWQYIDCILRLSWKA